MKLKSLLSVIMLLVSAALYAQTTVGGYINENTTWTAANSPYYVSSNVTVSENITLTIEDGVTVYGANITVEGTLDIGANTIFKFSNSRALTVESTGTLNINGTDGNPVYMTSINDDNWGGDTNENGSDTAPSSGNWYGLNLSSNNVSIDYLEIRYAGGGSKGAINFFGTNGTVDNTSISNSYYGIYITGAAAPTISNTTFGSAERTPIAMAFTANPTFTSNILSFSDNEYDAIGLLPETMTADRTIVKRSFGEYDNLTYLLLGNVVIPEGRTLTIEEGVVLKSISGYRFEVQGTLEAVGTADTPIVFTSVKDDTYGQPVDTNRDGNTTTPNYYDMGGFLFTETSSGTLDHCVIRYNYEDASNYKVGNEYPNYTRSYAAINILGGTVSITNSEIRDVQYGIASQKAASPTINNNELTAIQYAPFQLSLSANPTFSGNTFTSVGSIALALLSETISANGTIRKRTVGGYENITYTTSGDITIAENTLVDVEPGVVIKVGDRDIFTVNGGFKIEGTEEEPITFTSLKDDNIGNPLDTNGDGNDSAPDRGDWGNILYTTSSNDTYNKVDNAVIKYGGYHNNSGAKAMLRLQSASFEVSNSLISEGSTWGVSFEGDSEGVLTNCTITNLNEDPIAIGFLTNPTFSDNTISAVGYNSIFLLGSHHSYPNLDSEEVLSPRAFAGYENIAYRFGSDFEIKENGDLTITEGAILKSSYSITVDGSLKIKGSEQNPVVITSLSDDAFGGDTNANGNESVPSAGNWGGITFSESSHDNIIENSYLKFGRVITFENTQTTSINNNDISFVYGDAFKIIGSASPTISNNTLSNVSSHPIYMSMFATPTFSGNTMSNMGYYAIALIAETYSQSTSFIKRNFAGYENITYTLHGKSTIGSGATLTIPAGMVFKSYGSDVDALRVEGKLIIEGTEQDSVVFTDIHDDHYGSPKDSQLDGPSTYHDYNDSWIIFEPGSSDESLIDNTIFKSFETGIIFKSSSATIQNSKLERAIHTGIALEGVSSPIIKDNIFNDLERDDYGDFPTPIRMSLASKLEGYSGNVLSGNTARVIEIKNETLVQDAILPKITFAGINAIPYYFTRYIIGSGVNLTINPGVIIKCDEYIKVNGSIKAEGTVDNTIIFTSRFDKYYGGDSYPPSHENSGEGFWYGLKFEDQSDDSKNIFSNVVIKDAVGGGYSYNGAGGVILESASPTFTNSLFIRKGTTSSRPFFSISGASNPTINNSDFVMNSDALAIENTGTFQVDATNNWWGENSGPTHTGNTDGAGAGVSDNVNYDPWKQNFATNPQTGDVSLNGSITAYDASLVLQSLVEQITLDENQARVANTSGETGVTAMDASYILQYKAGVIDAFPAESSNRRIAKAVTALSIAGIEVKAGEEFSIAVSLSQIQDLMALQGGLSFDNELLEFVDFEWSEEAKALGVISAFNTNSKVFRFAMTNGLSNQFDGILGHLVLKAKDIKGIHSTSIGLKDLLANENSILSDIGEINITGDPEATVMKKLYPNPVNSGSALHFDYMLAKAGSVQIEVYDAIGNLVYSTVENQSFAGYYSTTWTTAQSGMYYVHLTSEEGEEVQKVVVK